MSDENTILNPNIKEVMYGKKELKSLTIYPLSMGDQFKVTNMVTEIVSFITEANKTSVGNAAFATIIIQSIEANIGKFLCLITDKSEEETDEVINQLTNIQLMEIVEYIWETNYEPSLKKGKALFERGKNLFLSNGPLPDSSSSTPSTDLKKFTEKPSEKEA